MERSTIFDGYIGISTFSMAIFNSYLSPYQRVPSRKLPALQEGDDKKKKKSKLLGQGTHDKIPGFSPKMAVRKISQIDDCGSMKFPPKPLYNRLLYWPSYNGIYSQCIPSMFPFLFQLPRLASMMYHVPLTAIDPVDPKVG